MDKSLDTESTQSVFVPTTADTSLQALADHGRAGGIVAAQTGGVGDWDLESGAVVCSVEWKRMLGYGDDEIGPQANAWRQLLHPDDVTIADQALDGVIHGARDY